MLDLESLPVDNNPADRFKMVSYCPVCSQQYKEDQVKIIEVTSSNCLVYTVCPQCKSSRIALIVTSSLGVSSIGMVTDLTKADVLLYKDVSVVSADDVIAISELVHQKTFLT